MPSILVVPLDTVVLLAGRPAEQVLVNVTLLLHQLPAELAKSRHTDESEFSDPRL